MQMDMQRAAASTQRELEGLRLSERQAYEKAELAANAQQQTAVEAADLKDRLQILMETVETLQAGNAGQCHLSAPDCCGNHLS